MNKRNGFTLVELMGILVVLALIIALAVPAITGTLRRQGDNQVDLYEEQVCTAAIAYIDLERKVEGADPDLVARYGRIINGDATSANEPRTLPIQVTSLIESGFLASSAKHPTKGNNVGVTVTLFTRAGDTPGCEVEVN